MNSFITTIIEQCAKSSHEGTASFGAIVHALIEAGVESYFADYRLRTTTYYLPSGETHVVPLATPSTEIPTPFDKPAIQAAIHGAQRGEVRYPEFMRLSMAAGCVGYIVWMSGRHVAYLGRCGEVHIEHFPSTK
jgi:uncharacterized protein YbcV (DUF1398 family)